MDRRQEWGRSSLFVVAFGSLLLVVAVAYHAREIATLDGRFGSVLALLLDAAPAIVLVYAGVRLSRTELTARGRWRVVRWGLGGSLVFVAVIGATILVRLIEGRAVEEPVFTLLVAVEAGAIAGLVAGYYNARVRADSRRARNVSGVLGFVNGLRSVVDNLLENAAEHNDADDPRVAVTVETGADTVRLLVSDNGPGIPDEEKRALLAPAAVGGPDRDSRWFERWSRGTAGLSGSRTTNHGGRR